MDRSEYWIRFVCGFLVFGALGAVCFGKWIDGWHGLAISVLVLLAISHFTAKRGDTAWRSILEWFHWW